ncbi:hypothetical protein CDFC105_43989 [Clostridioides difficile]|nr:hypothetical protein CDFC105_43989 [Clostridioides difficile]
MLCYCELLLLHGCLLCFFFLTMRRPPRSTRKESSAASDVYKRQAKGLPNALSYAIDRKAIVDSVLLGHGVPAYSPLQMGPYNNCLLYTSPSPRD